MFFGIDQLPGAFSLCVFGTPLVMPFNSIIKVISRADVVGAILQALDYVYIEGHG